LGQPWYEIVKLLIRKLSAPTEFCLVIFICFGLTIFANSVWIVRHLSHVPLTPTNSVVRLNNDGIIVSVILELLTLGIVLLIGRIRGWSLTTFGLQPSWNWTGAGVLLFFAFLLVQRILGVLTRMVFHSTVDFHRVSHLTIPFIILISIINPFFEEAMESGYFFNSLQRHGMWLTVLAAALFRGFLHTTMGISGFVTMFAMGLLYGFFYWRWRQLWPLIVAHSLQMVYSLVPQAFAA
jgi:membrane protease YdiL (CAAX protease family)